MAILHVWASGSNTAPYETWAKAAVLYATATAAAAAGDTIYVASDHSENPAGQSIDYTNGTAALPIIVLGGTRDTVSGITALATGAVVGTSTTGFTAGGGHAYIYGISFEANNASSTTMNICNSAHFITYESCDFRIHGTSASSNVTVGPSTASDGSRAILVNCRFDFSNASQTLTANYVIEIYGGSIISGSAAQATFCNVGSGARGAIVKIDGFDFSNGPVGMDIFNDGSGAQFARAANCIFPASWSGSIHEDVPAGSNRYELINCSSTDQNFKFWTSDIHGECKDEITIKRTGGAENEEQDYSIRMATTANCSYPGHVLRSPPIYKRNSTLTAQTATVHFVVDSATSEMTDDQIWLELEYQGTAGFPQGVIGTDRRVLTASTAAQATSSEAWSGDSGTGPNGSASWYQQKLDVTFTADEVGYLIATVCVAKPSWTVFVDPTIELS